MRLLSSPRWTQCLQVSCIALVASVMLASFQLLGHQLLGAQGKERTVEHPTLYRTTQVDGLSIFYREADPKEFAYTFDHYAEIMNHFTEALGLSHYTLYMQDYGGPVGFRMALAHPNRIEALIVQDAVAHNEGLGANWKPRRAFWADRTANESTLRTNLLSLPTTRTRHVGNDPNVERYDPDLWTDEFTFLNQPSQADIQSDLFYDYRTNVDSYPRWQAWMRERQPRLLVIWGKYDLSFELSEPEAYRRDVPNAEVHVLDTGHFALDTKADEIAALADGFMKAQK